MKEPRAQPGTRPETRKPGPGRPSPEKPFAEPWYKIYNIALPKASCTRGHLRLRVFENFINYDAVGMDSCVEVALNLIFWETLVLGQLKLLKKMFGTKIISFLNADFHQSIYSCSNTILIRKLVTNGDHFLHFRCILVSQIWFKSKNFLIRGRFWRFHRFIPAA